jgi:glycosyltransferase involved in cell wall biosynthesis
MKVGILSMKGNFDKTLGQGVQTYIYEIWKHTGYDKIELGFGKGSIAKVSFTLSSMLHDYSKYDIIHMPAPIMMNPRARKKVTTLHELYAIPEGHPLYNPKKGGWIQNAIGGMIKNQIMKSDYLLADSTQVVLEAIDAGYPKDRIFMVNVGIGDKFIKEPIKRRARKHIVVGYIGSNSLRKNPGAAAKGFSLYEDDDAVFEMYGNFSKSSVDVSDKRIRLNGFIPEEDKVATYAMHDINFLYTS